VLESCAASKKPLVLSIAVSADAIGMEIVNFGSNSTIYDAFLHIMS